MTVKSRLFYGVSLCALLPMGQACAQAAAPVATQVQQLQQQIQQLQQQLQSIQNQVNAQAQQPSPIAAAAAPPVPGPHITQSPANRFSIESADGKYSIGLTTQLHFDAGGYAYTPDAKGSGSAPHDLDSGVNARRARFGFLGKLDGDWAYTFIYDFGGSTDNGTVTGSGTGAATNTSGIEKGYLTYNGLYDTSHSHGTAFDVGYQDTPFTLDEATSSNDIMFMERASSQVVATELGAGDYRSAVGVRSNDERYWAGAYVTGPQSGGNHAAGTGAGEPVSMFGRASYQILSNPDYSLHFGIDVLGMIHPPTATATGIAALTLSDRPELRIDPTAIMTTGSVIGTTGNPLTGGQALGYELAGGYDNVFAQSEGYDIRIDRQDLPTNNFYGGYLEGSWTITGEQRKYLPATGAYSGINPMHPFSWSEGQWGAFELAARYSYMNLDDNAGSAPAAAAAAGAVAGTPQISNGVAGGRQQVVTLGLNWYLNPDIRFMFNYLHGVIDKPGTGTGIAVEGGAKFDAVAMRTQVAF